jgi:hypothetical protein
VLNVTSLKPIITNNKSEMTKTIIKIKVILNAFNSKGVALA